MAEVEGVTGLVGRNFLARELYPAVLEGKPLGVFVVHATADDAHSPVMLPVYDELAAIFENQIPLVVIDARDEAFEFLRKEHIVTAVPTLIWTKAETNEQGSVILLRTVGTVMLPKLEKEVNERIDELLGD